MRQSVLCFLAILCLETAAAFARQDAGGDRGWNWQNPLPQGNALHDVDFADSLTGTAVGDAGTILRTTDGGQSWLLQHSGTNENLWAVHFTGPLAGTAVGTNGTILSTLDGGESWVARNSGTTGTVRDVSFSDSLTGTAVVDLGGILRTTDGGQSWSPVSVPAIAGILSVFFADALTGTAVGPAGTILRTTDGGSSWALQNSGTAQNLFAVYFPTTNFGIAVGAGGTILRTTDGGETWTALTIGNILPFLGLCFGDSLHGIAVGFPGVNYLTTDAGLTWAPRPSGTSSLLWHTSFLDVNKGYAVGENGAILRTLDAGNNWQSQTSGTTNSLFGVSFAGENLGIIVGDYGTIMRTTDGGGTWVSAASGTSRTIWSVAAANTGVATAVGSLGLVLRTSNGGAAWVSQTSGSVAQLLGVSHAGPDNATAVGAAGTILRITNGGATWVSQTSGVSQTLNAVCMVNTSIAFAAGSSGVILRTTDGGANWTGLTSGTTAALYGIVFTDAAIGSAAGAGGTILRTTDGGQSWAAQTSGVSVSLSSVDFATTMTGTAVGYGGTILRTNDAGLSWTVQSSGTSNYLACVDLVDENHATTVGFGGTILHTDSGGEMPAPAFSASPPVLAMGDVLIGSFVTDTVTVTNTGSAVLLISSVESDNSRFTVAPTNAVLTPLSSRNFLVTFTPVSTGLKTAHIEFRSNAADSPDTVLAQGTGIPPALGKFLTVPPETIVARDPYNGKLLKPVRRGRHLYPNWANLLSDVAFHGGFRPGSTESDTAGGMRVGVSSMISTGVNRWKPRPDYASLYCWVRMTRWNFRSLTGSGYKTLQATLWDNTGLHTGPPRGLDATGVPGDLRRRPLAKQQSKLAPRKHNNRLYAELVALKLNIAASQLGTTPVGFGELELNRPGNPFENLSLVQISARADSMMTFWRSYPSSDYDSLYSVLYAVNRAFVGPMDTLSFEADKELILDGAVDLNTVSFLRLGGTPPRHLIPTASLTEPPDESWLNDEDGGDLAGMASAARLYQNYPNPFNPTTTIAFTLKEYSRVTIRVYDLLGSEVGTLLDGEEIGEGYQTIDFNAANLASGIYFFRIDAQGLDESGLHTVATQKMVLLK